MKENKGVSLCEAKFDENGLRFRHENPNPMTAEQKFNLILATLGLIAFLGFFMTLTLSVR